MPNYFTVTGLEPLHDPTWHTASVPQRAAYLRVCRVLVLTEWDRQTAAGLDKDGRRLAPLKPDTIRRRHSAMGPADPNAPPLQPAHQLSRTRSLVDAKAVGTSVQVYWKFDPVSGKRWGTILNYHRVGARGLPARDVFGLSPAAKAAVLDQAHRWWAGYSRGLPVAMPTRPRPGKAGRPAAAVQPAYRPQSPPPGEAPPPRIVDLQLGADVYTMTGRAARELLGAIRSGRFTGFRSYAGGKAG